MNFKLEDWVITNKNEMGVIDRVCFDGYIVKFNTGKYGFYTEEQGKNMVKTSRYYLGRNEHAKTNRCYYTRIQCKGYAR